MATVNTFFQDFATGFKEVVGNIFGEDGIGGLLSGLGDGIMDSLGGMMEGMGAALSSLSDMLMKFVTALFMADGGYVQGPGTGTSDSVPAMLSNREFVVNAQQTSKFRPLLESINSGRISRFAEGGLVTPNKLSTPTPMAADSFNNMDTSQAQTANGNTVNINITGDISRQTKQEIYAMLPQISEGVNSYNREKG